MAKHFMIYYKNGTGTYIVTEPRPWARENQHLFPQFDFINNHPTTEVVENYLVNNHNFEIVVETERIVVIQNLDPELDL